MCQENDKSKQCESQKRRLINEAIKRILLDIVIRGHGDRLIGRWSRDQDLQQFLDQVPYLLDRINQLHLACTRTRFIEELDHVHHYHHHHHYHRDQNQFQNSDSNNKRRARARFHEVPGAGPSASALSDFVKLIGDNMHWLVRTRDPLGLCPLHKAVLYNNTPIVEHIVDRYQHELAPPTSSAFSSSSTSSIKPPKKLIDAQDKYGRTALHYAAALINGPNNSRQTNHLYHFLISRRADQELEDFRGKKAAFYLINPEKLMVRNIIYLDNKVNASQQANILSKTLKCARERAIKLREFELHLLDEEGDDETMTRAVDYSRRHSTRSSPIQFQSTSTPSSLLSASCNELRDINQDPKVRAQTNCDSNQEFHNLGRARSHSNVCTSKTMRGKPNRYDSGDRQDPGDCIESDNKVHLVARHLVQERTATRTRCLNRELRNQIVHAVQEADLEKLNEFLIEGYGDFMSSGDLLASSCWNQQCKRYLTQVIPEILNRVDCLHEAIAGNNYELVRSMIANEPILARIKRPYRRASTNSLQVAIQCERPRIIYHLIEHLPELVWQRDSLGATCLHYAARNLNLDKLYCWLLESHGGELEETRDLKGRTASDYRHHAIRLASLSQQQTTNSSPKQIATHRECGDNHDELTINGQNLQLTTRQPRRKTTSTSSGKTITINDAGATTTTTPVPRTAGAMATPTPHKKHLETTIIECIKLNDTKKLEHLILANCGPKIELVYEKLRKSGVQISLSMQDFCENHTPAYRLTIERLHEILHNCFAYNKASDHLDHSIESDDVQLLRFNNLLADKRLVMSRDRFGATPLHVSVLRADIRLLEILIWRQPEVVSAPDLEGRNSIHYAAIASSAHKHHGPMKLTREPTDDSQKPVPGFWLLDSTIEGIYEKLSDRYTNLMQIRDKSARIPEDYLKEKKGIENGLQLMAEGAGTLTLRDPQELIGSCCADYARLLNRYRYKIIVHDEARRQDQMNGGDSTPMQTANSNASNGEQSKKVFVLDEKPSERSEKKVIVLTRKHHQQQQPKKSLAGASNKSSDNQERKNNNDNIHKSSPKESPSDSNLWLQSLKADVLGVGNSAINGMNSPSNSDGVVMQVAPKTTVGSTQGYPSFLRSPTNLSLCVRSEPASCNSQRESPGASTILPPDCSATELINSVVSRQDTSYVENLSQGDSLLASCLSKTRYQRSHLAAAGTNSPSSYVHKSVVGGVIVPSIIHDEKSGEIETYDVIYRQPPPAPNSSPRPGSSGSGSGGRARGRSYCGTRATHSVGEGGSYHNHRRNIKPLGARNLASRYLAAAAASAPVSAERTIAKSVRRASNNDDSETVSQESDDDDSDLDGQAELSRILNNANAKVAINSDAHLGMRIDEEGDEVARSGGHDRQDDEQDDAQDSEDIGIGGDEDDEDYDDRVERLSNEFDMRVTREKNELRAKVDQIMSEIRVNTKSVSSSGDAGASSQGKNLAPSGQALLGSSTSTPQDTNSSYTTRLTSATSASATSTTTRTSSSSRNSTSATARNHVEPARPASACSSLASFVSLVSSNGAKRDTAHEEKQSNDEKRQQQLSSFLQHNSISKNAYGQTYLHFICSRAQDAPTLYKILGHASHLIGERDTFYRTARDVAVQFNLPENVIVIDEFIIDAFISARTDLLRHLLSQGYSPLIHVSDPDGNDIMLILKLLKLDKMINLLLQMADFQRWRDELHTFIRHGYSAGVNELINKHQDLVKSKSMHSRTSLHLAVLFGRHDILDVLLKRDPSCVHAIDNMSRIALHYAYALRSPNMAKIRQKLIDFGSNQEARDVKMRMPKYYSIFSSEIEDIKRAELELN